MEINNDSDYRGQEWDRAKSKALDRVVGYIDEWLEELVSRAIDDYIDSSKFIEDAETFCREQGWKEPE